MAHFNQHLHSLDTILYQVRIYRDPQRIRGEVADILMKPHVASLTPQSRPLARGGPPQHVLCLVGTIPINYNGASYNIPINVWLVENYPFAPPVIYVTPTSDMTIAPRHKHVDVHGMVYHPYLSAWNPSTSNLIGIITNLSSVFSAEPPVRAQAPTRPAPAVPTPAATTTSTPSYPPPGYPPQNNQPYPPPQQQQQQQQPPNNNNNINNNNNNNNMNYSSYSSQTPPTYSQPQQQQPPSYSQPPAYYSQQPQQQQQQQQPPSYPNPPEYTPPKPEDPEVVEKRNALAKITEKLIAKLKVEQTEVISQIEGLERERDSCNEVAASIGVEVNKVTKEIDQVEQEIKQTTEKLEETKKWIEQNDQEENPDIDIVTDPKDPLSKQLLTLVAADYTIQDTTYYLDKALAADKIPLEAYLKTIRALSREQFVTRATMKKVEAAQRQQLIQHHHQQIQQPQQQQQSQQQYQLQQQYRTNTNNNNNNNNTISSYPNGGPISSPSPLYPQRV